MQKYLITKKMRLIVLPKVDNAKEKEEFTKTSYSDTIMFKRSLRSMIFPLWIYVLVVALRPVSALSGSIPVAGSHLPEFQLEAPSSEKERAYLGIGAGETFSVNQPNCQIILIEIVGVYCPQCHIQMPLFNKLFYRIKRDADINEKTKMLAVAIGATAMELAYFKKKHNIPYPVIKDPNFEIHKLLGEPRTPFIMLVSRDKKVVFAHLGIIRDIDKFLLKIKEFLK